ncbi:Glycosyl_transferases group 1 family protein [Hexamita inflata]|uniref:Glycosyl transferases group 1 family protein n=1 Tax=Hexamita inflata TaxID=28002 RepID=A0AA86NE73_9EUKA|nr:Glycosyl transferases group 1 family protein [Hexamita inflata]
MRLILSNKTEKKKYQLIKWKNEHKIDIFVLQEHWLVQNFHLIEFLRAKNCKVIAIQHNFFLFPVIVTNDKKKNNFILNASIATYKMVDALVCLSKTDMQLWKASNAQNVVYIPNPLTFDPNQIQVSNLTSKNIILVGRLDKIFKQQHVAVEMMSKVVLIDPEIQLQIIGNGDAEYATELKQLVLDLNLSSNVQFVPFQKNITQYYQNAAAMWVTSSMEGYSMVVAEAKVFGLPVVAFDLEYPLLWEAGMTKVDYMDRNGMVRATIEILSNRTLALELQREALQSIEDIYTHKTVQKWKRVIGAVMDNQPITAESGVSTEKAKKVLSSQLKVINPDLFALYEQIQNI